MGTPYDNATLPVCAGRCEACWRPADLAQCPFILRPSACSKLSCLEALEICNGAITDAGVSALAGLKSLSTLSLGQNPRITDASILQLARATNLVTLNLSRSRVTGAGLMPLARLTVRAGVLHLSVGGFK